MQGRLVVAVVVLAAAVAGCGKKRAAVNPGAQAEAAGAGTQPPGSAAADAGRGGEEDPENGSWGAPELAAARATLEQRVYFGFDQYDLDDGARRIVEAKAEILRTRPSIRLRITGHADEQGTTEYNLALGMRRAAAVRESFESHGLNGRRFEVASMGEEEPLVAGSTGGAHARNRRAEFTVLGGLPPAPRP